LSTNQRFISYENNQ